MKKIVIILVIALFAINGLFAQDSLQTELNEFKKFVHYCKIHNTEIVNIDPVLINDVVTKKSSKKIEKLFEIFFETANKNFLYLEEKRDNVERFFPEGDFINLVYQVSSSELFFVRIFKDGEMLFYKTTKNEFNRLVNQDFTLIAKYRHRDAKEFYSSEDTLRKMLLYMIDMNRKSIIYTID